ncbi:FAD/NAD-P-binding domain-containing protein [Dentipellis sp. KUC8613]|nr:FAD/NAD-P-binding domain-containing protein [Dentipellis sp. KUC8613]
MTFGRTRAPLSLVEPNGWAQPEAKMSPSSTKDFRVAIVGGGVCGVVCAIALQQTGIQSDIFEAASRYGEVGAGLGIGPNAVRILRKLDLMAALSKEAEPTSARPFKFVFGTGETGLCFEAPVDENDLSLAMHRASFLDVLVASIDPALTRTHFNKRCTSVSESTSTRPRLTLHFADGTTHETDLVLGADGVKSTVRSFVVGEDSPQKNATFTNTVVYRGLVRMNRVKDMGVEIKVDDSGSVVWMGNDRCLTMFPVRNDTLLSVSSVVTDYSVPMGQNAPPPGQPWVLPASQDELLDNFKGWRDEPMAVLKCLQEPTKWFLHGMYPPLNSYVKGQVALIGDAAHAMLPFLGAGAGQGIEDAYVIARLLSQPQTNISNLEAVLKAYSLVRVPRASDVALRSKRCRDIFEGHGPSGPSSQGRSADAKGMWEAVWHHDLDADVEVAFEWLREQKTWT